MKFLYIGVFNHHDQSWRGIPQNYLYDVVKSIVTSLFTFSLINFKNREPFYSKSNESISNQYWAEHFSSSWFVRQISYNGVSIICRVNLLRLKVYVNKQWQERSVFPISGQALELSMPFICWPHMKKLSQTPPKSAFSIYQWKYHALVRPGLAPACVLLSVLLLE